MLQLDNFEYLLFSWSHLVPKLFLEFANCNNQKIFNKCEIIALKRAKIQSFELHTFGAKVYPFLIVF